MEIDIDIVNDLKDPVRHANELLEKFVSNKAALLHVEYMISIVGNIEWYDGRCNACGAERATLVAEFFKKVKIELTK